MKTSIGNNAVKLSISKMITLFISMLTAMLLSRFRTLEEYGTYSQLLLVINLAISVFTLGLPNSTNYFLSKADNDNEKTIFLSTYYSLNTVLCIIMGIFLALSAKYIAKYFDNENIHNFIYVLLILPWSKVISSSISNVLIVYGKTSKLVLFNILQSLFFLLSIVISQILNLSFEKYMMIYMFVESTFAITVYVMISNILKKMQFILDWRIIKSIFIFSIPLGLATIVGTINIELDKLLIGNFYNTEQLAIYTNAAKEMPVTIIASSLTAVLMPQLVRFLKDNKKVEAVNLWSDTVVLSYIIICFISTALIVFAPQVISLLYSEKYLPGISVFRIYSLVLLLRVTYWGIILNAIGKTKFILYSSLLSVILNIILNFVFYKIYGFEGPAIATFISMLVIIVFQLIYSAKLLDIKIRFILPWKNLLKVTFINLILSFFIVILIKFIQLDTSVNGIIKSIIIGLLWMIMYFLVMFKDLKLIWNKINNI